jgi:hypothetical protein
VIGFHIAEACSSTRGDFVRFDEFAAHRGNFSRCSARFT